MNSGSDGTRGPRTVQEIRSSFLILPTDEFLRPLVVDHVSEATWTECLSNARAGLESVISAAGLPFELMNSSVVSHRFDRFFTAERIRALGEEYPNGNRDEFTKDERNRFAKEIADRKMAEFMASDAGRNEIVEHVLAVMDGQLDRPTVVFGAEELLIQALIGSWSVFEAFSRSMIVTLLNEFPRLVGNVVNSSDLKELLGKQPIDLQMIGEFGYDLSKSMGTVLFRSRRLDSLGHIRSIFKCIFSEREVQQALGKSVWVLNQRRHLFVHRRGIVDQEYLSNTGDSLPLGQKLRINALDLEESLRSVRDAIQSVCSAAEALGRATD